MSPVTLAVLVGALIAAAVAGPARPANRFAAHGRIDR